MLSLNHLKRRINVVKSTKKVIEAMRLISISTYPKTTNRYLAAKNYKNKLGEILNHLVISAPEDLSLPFFSLHPGRTQTLLIIIGSSKGLCGSFNGQLQRHAQNKLFFNFHETYQVITIGKRALSIAEEMNFSKKSSSFIEKNFEAANSKNALEISDLIFKHIFNKQNNYGQILFVYNTFKSLFGQEPKIRKILPVDREKLISEKTKMSKLKQNLQNFPEELIWEQDPEHLINLTFQKYLRAHIESIIFESILSETAARFVTTEGATNNAKKQLETLIIDYNKMRQSSITREVTELSSSI